MRMYQRVAPRLSACRANGIKATVRRERDARITDREEETARRERDVRITDREEETVRRERDVRITDREEETVCRETASSLAGVKETGIISAASIKTVREERTILQFQRLQ